MGYRSEVRSLVYGPKEAVEAFIITYQLAHGNKLFKEFEGNLRRYAITAAIYQPPQAPETDAVWLKEPYEVIDLYGQSWKWYPNYDDVVAWEAFLDLAQHAGLNTEFIRIGEETTDVEHRTSEQAQGYLGTSSPTIIDDIPSAEGEPISLTCI